MAQPPVFRSIDKDDIPELKNADRLLQPLSLFMEDTAKALDSGLTTRNLAAYVKTFEAVSQDADPPGFPSHSPTEWARPQQMVFGEKGKPFPGKVQEIRLLQAVRSDRGLPGPISFEGWQQGQPDKDGRLTVTLPRINGLAPGVRYTLTILVQAG